MIQTISSLPSRLDTIIFYQTEDGETRLDVQLRDETVWLTQAQMAELFERDQSVISRHLNNIFREKELPKQSNMQKMHIALSDKPIALYCLDVIISVGYRVKSQRGTQFRIAPTRGRGLKPLITSLKIEGKKD